MPLSPCTNLARAASNHRCKIADSAPRPTSRAISSDGAAKAPLPGAGAREVEPAEENFKKRKREDLDEADPKLQEYLEVMGHRTKKSKDQDAPNGGLEPELTSEANHAVVEAGESDDEYEEIPANRSKQPTQEPTSQHNSIPAPTTYGEGPVAASGAEPAHAAPHVSANATDDDWLRSRTSRLLDLVDPDDPGFTARAPQPVTSGAPTAEPQESPGANGAAGADRLRKVSPGHALAGNDEDVAELVKKTARLFLRNLSYTVTEEDIREYFGKFGTLEEVSTLEPIVPSGILALHDEPLIGTAYAAGI